MADTCFFIGVLIQKDNFHKRASEIVVDIDEGNIDTLQTCDYVVAETTTFVARRKDSTSENLKRALQLFESRWVEVVHTDLRDFTLAKHYLIQHANLRLSFTDCMLIAVVQRLNLDGILTFDGAFTKAGFVEKDRGYLHRDY